MLELKRYYDAAHAWVVTNNYFTEPARKLAHANDVLLIDRDLLIKLSAQVNREKQQPVLKDIHLINLDTPVSVFFITFSLSHTPHPQLLHYQLAYTIDFSM